MGGPLAFSTPGADFDPGERLRNLARNLRDPRRFLVQAGRLLANRARVAFREQKRGGVAWPARSVPNVIGILEDLRHDVTPPARRWSPRPAGVDSGNLRDSLTDDAVLPISRDTVQIGTKAPGAGTIQYGGEVDVEVDAPLKAKIKTFLEKHEAGAAAASKRAKRKEEQAWGFGPSSGDLAGAASASAKAAAAVARAGDLRGALGWLLGARVKGFTATIPARPFLAITEEDVEDIAVLWTDSLLKGLTARPALPPGMVA